MPIPVRLTCPKCGTRERMTVSDPMSMWDIDRNHKRVVTTDRNMTHFASCATCCPECRTAFGVILRPSSGTSMVDFFGNQNPASVDQALQGGAAVTYPQDPKTFTPSEELPPKIRAAFVFAQEDAARRRNAPGVLSTARGCLDVALKELGEAQGGRRERIANLADRGLITKGIAAWAQQLWDEGNDAVHDLDADMDRAIEHVEFLKLFFEVAFSLPARIEANSHLANRTVDTGGE